MRKSRHEFSKLIVKWTLIGFFIHVLIANTLTFFQVDVGPQINQLLYNTIPVYMVVLGGYFGKAGFENYNKIKYETASQYEVG